MPKRGELRFGLGLRLSLLAGVMSGSGGCAIHHYHHFDDGAGAPRVVQVILPDSKESNQTPAGATESTPGNSQVVQVAHQQSEKPGQADSLQLPRRGESPGDAKSSAPEVKDLPKKLTLDQAISATLAADPRIRSGFELINQANADLLTSSLFPNPTLIPDGIFLPLQRFTPDRPGGPPQTDIGIGYSIDWFLFGKRTAAMVSSSLGVRVSEADYANLIRTRVTMTATAFYTVVETKAVRDLVRQDVDNLTKLAEAMKKAADAGGRALVELNRIRLDLLKSQQDLREAESAFVAAKANLRALLGRSDADADFDVEGSLDAPLTSEPLPVEEAFTLAQQNRPDIRSLRIQVSKAQADTEVERRKAFPQVTPQFGYTRQFQQPVGFPDADTWDVTVNITLPIFDRNQGNRAKAQSIAAQNTFNLQGGLVDLRSEIEQIVQEFRTARQNANAVAQDQLKLAKNVLDSITSAYQAGGRPLIEVLDAERSYRDTYRLYISSRANYWRAVYKFSSAIGKQVRPNDEQQK